ncbi:MAG: T9SS type A sorting domain-containing protein [Elusimicrobia bacterium]|nr:T9SS type A sorting domain-containing protein [Elusimicrobiota bacterium]
MRLLSWILQASRLFLATTLLAGPSVPLSAGFESAPSFSYKDGALLPDAAKAGVQNPVLPAGKIKMPLYFEKNHGQTDASVKFFTRAAGYNLYLTASEAVTVLPRAEADKAKGALVVRMKLKGANANPAVEGLEILPGRTSYFTGSDRAKWQVGVEQYNKVKLAQVYPGIDMVYRFADGSVEYDFVVAPGANPGRILMGFEGSKGLRLDAKGNLVIRVEGGELTYKAPQLYQMLGSRRTSVTGRFALASNNQARFEIGNYIKSEELVIDPAIAYGTYLGGSVDDAITAIAVDGTQQAYVTGWSNSAQSGAGGFPAATKTFPSTALTGTIGGRDAFVAKLSADGSTLMWLAWLGGTLADQANGIALDKSSVSEPKVFITGVTNSAGAGTSFPVAGPALQTCDTNTGSLAFIAELEQPSNIPGLVYSTCWGGVSGILTNTATAIAVDSLGAAYMTGTTFATNFPISAGIAAPYNTMGSASEASFVVKIAPAGASVVYSMLMGTSDTTTNANAIAVDALGQAWIAGKTTSDTWPAAALSGHFSELRTAGVWSDAFVAQVAADGTSLLYATYINGATADEATAIALNNGGAAPYNVFVAGWTVSPTDFPSTAYLLLPIATRPTVYQKSLQGADDAFILRLNPFEAAADRSLEMVYATHVGAANGADRATSLALDSRDDAYISGWTRSSNWPVAGNDTLVDCSLPCVSRNVAGAVETNTSSDQAAFVAAIGPDGLTRPFFTYLGASPGTYDLQRANGIVIDAAHNIYVAGVTPSNTFPATTGSLMDGSAGTELLNGTGTENATDGFITKIAPVLAFGGPLDISSPTISIAQPAGGSFMNYTSTMVIVNFADETGGSGISTSTLVIRLDSVALATSTFVLYNSSATVQLSGLSQSTHTINASIADNSGNVATTTNTFTVDLASPTIAIVQPANGSFLNYTSTMAVINYSDAGGSGLSTSTLVIKLDNVALSTGTFTRYASSATVQLSGLSAAAHTLDASIMDHAGNLKNAVQTGFTVDLTSPTIAVVQPADGSFLNYASTMAVVNYSDAGGSGLSTSTLIIKLDNVALSTSTFTRYASSATVQLSGLSAAAHTLDASIRDHAGNLKNAVQTGFSVNLTSPTITIGQPANGSYMNATSTLAVVNYADNGSSGLSTATLVIKLDNVALSTSTFSRYASSATVQLSGLSAAAHTLDASIMDNSGNLSNAVQAGFTVALSSPAIGISVPANSGFLYFASTTAVITYSDAGGSGLNLASLVVKLDGVTIAHTALAGSATASLASLTEGAHTVYASIANNLGNISTTLNTFTVSLTPACGEEYFYPSPAKGAAGTFVYCMSRSGTVKIRVYNTIGDLVAKIEDIKAAGGQSSGLNTGRLAPGVYLYRVEKTYGSGDTVRSNVKKFSVQH